MAYTSTHTGQLIDDYNDRISNLETSDSTQTTKISTLESSGLNHENRISSIESLLTSILNNITNMWQTIYPIGSIYISINNTSPATLFGGTWTLIQDRFLLAAGNTYTAGNTGGSATMAHTHSLVAGTTGGPSTNTSGSTTLTVDQMPSHRHYIALRQQWYNSDVVTNANTGSIYSWKSGTGGTTSAGYKGANGDDISHTGGGLGHTHTLSSHTHSISATTTGGASNTDNMPPYLAVYMWKRTA